MLFILHVVRTYKEANELREKKIQEPEGIYNNQ
jgi:hypothetical protein